MSKFRHNFGTREHIEDISIQIDRHPLLLYSLRSKEKPFFVRVRKYMLSAKGRLNAQGLILFRRSPHGQKRTQSLSRIAVHAEGKIDEKTNKYKLKRKNVWRKKEEKLPGN